jgi:hypothetical protein
MVPLAEVMREVSSDGYSFPSEIIRLRLNVKISRLTIHDRRKSWRP